VRDDERAATRICRLNFFETGDCSLRGVMEVFTSRRVMGSGNRFNSLQNQASRDPDLGLPA